MSEGMSAPSAPSTPSNQGGQNVGNIQSQSPKPSQQGSTASTPTTSSQNAAKTSPEIQSSETREYKINGKMVKMTQREADDYVSMSYAAQERFNEAARMRKEVEAKEHNYAKNPLQAFLDYAEKAKLTPEQTRQALEDYYAKQWIEPETLSKEELALRQREARVKKWEEEQKERHLQEKEHYQRKMTDEQIENVTSEITSALENAQLPQRNKFLVQRMAFYMYENNKNGWNAPKEMILKQVVNEHQGIVGSFLKEASMDQIFNYAGQEFIDRVLKFSLDKLREGRNKLQEPFVSDQASPGNQVTGKIDYSEVNRRLRDMRTGKFV